MLLHRAWRCWPSASRFKVAAVPFHMWTPDVYEGAPAPVTAFMAGGVKAAAFAAFLRVFLAAFPAMYDTWYAIACGGGRSPWSAANLVALVQSNVKRMLAYSSIAHAGYLLVALAAAEPDGRGRVPLLPGRLHAHERSARSRW